MHKIQRGKVQKMTNTNTNKTNYTEKITAGTIYQKANSIAVKALLTNYQKSGSKFTRKLYISAVRYAKSGNITDDGNGGADIVQEVALYLSHYIGRDITDADDSGAEDANGEPITILRGAFRAVQTVITARRTTASKVAFLEDYDNGALVRVPREWDIDSVCDLREIEEKIDSMNLSGTQLDVLRMRLQGKGCKQIAKARGTSHQAVQKTVHQIQAKYIILYGVPACIK